jgi:hypothetical protein
MTGFIEKRFPENRLGKVSFFTLSSPNSENFYITMLIDNENWILKQNFKKQEMLSSNNYFLDWRPLTNILKFRAWNSGLNNFSHKF